MSTFTSLVDPFVGRIQVKTTMGPDVLIDDPFRAQAEGAAGAAPPAGGAPTFDLARILKPKLLVYDRNGGAPVEFAPYGDPGESLWPVIVIGLGLLIGGLAYGTWRGMRRR